MEKIIFLLSPRHEIAQIASSINEPLRKKGLCLLPIITETGKVGEWNQVNEIFNRSKIIYKSLSDFPLSNALEILKKEQPSLVITDNDLLGPHNAFVLAGNYLHIPIVVIRESTYLPKDLPNFGWMLTETLAKLNQLPRLLKKYLFYARSGASTNPMLLRNIPKLFKEVILSNFEGQLIGQYADYILANTQSDADFLEKNCSNVRFVRVVGNPVFDKMLKTVTVERKEILQSFKLPENKKILLFLSGAQVEHGILKKEQKILANKEILEILETFSDKISVVIKLHPIEEDLFPLTWKQEYDGFIIVTRYDLNKLIQVSDIVITWPSTAMLDVILATKPLVVMDFFSQRVQGAMTLLSENSIDEGAAYEVFDSEKLKETLSSLILNDKIRGDLVRREQIFSLRHLGIIDGKSNERIADSIIEAIKDYNKQGLENEKIAA